MARFARVVVANVAYPVTQRGNARQFLLASDAERLVYLDLFRTAVQLEGLSVQGFCLVMKRWGRQWTGESWRAFLEAGESETDRAALRRCTRTGRPLGSEEFIAALEQTTHRRLVPQKGGRPRKRRADKRERGPL